MSSWLSLALPLLASLGTIAVLGLPAALALRLRGFVLAMVSVAAGFAVLALTPLLAAFAGVPWGPLPPLVMALAIALVLLILRRWISPRAPRVAGPHRFWLPVGCAAVGGTAIATTLVMSLKSADAVSQTYDAIFHLNAVRQVLDTGSAAPFDLDLAAPGQSVFYPALWHGFVALIVQLTGVSIPLATNAVLFAVCAVVWPIGAVGLGRAVAGPSARATIASGVIAAAFPSFPLVLAGYGVLYPNLLSTALLPYAFIALLQLLNLGPARRGDPLAPGTRWLLFLGAFGAAALAHPNALHVTLLWIAFPVIAAAARTMRSGPTPRHGGLLLAPHAGRRPFRITGAALGLLVLAIAFVAAWLVGRTSDNPWEGKRGPLGAIVDALGSTPHLEGHAWPVTLLVLIGVVVAWRRRSLRWTIGTAAVLYAMFIVAYGFPASSWRTLLLSPWYNDPWRLASLISLGALPLAVLGASAAMACLRPGLQRTASMLAPKRPRLLRGLFAGCAVLFLLAASQGAGAYAGVQYVSTKYVANDESKLLSPDERALLERLPNEVPEDETIVDNPWNGGALAYALSDRRVLVPHTGGTYDPRITEMTRDLADGTPRACELAHELDVSFVLDFGERYVFKNTPRAEPFAGISGVEESPVLTEVDREGDAVLYEVTGCG